MKCRDGCEGERKTTQIVCGECWARVPQHLKEIASWATTLWMEINASVAIFDWLAADDKRSAASRKGCVMDAKNIQALLTEADGFYSAHSDVMNLVCGLAAALKASEEQNGAIRRGLDWERAEREKVAEFARKIGRERDDLAIANLAANKRIVELEREAERLITQRDRWEEQVGDMAASAGCEEEFSNWHDHKDCVEECVTVLKTERDAARAELAQPSICPNCTAKLRRLDRMDAAGHAAYELDKARKDAAGQNKRAQKAEQEAKALRAELARLTTPRPIAEAPRDGTWILGVWLDIHASVPTSIRWVVDAWVDENHENLNEPSHYLPLPEVKP